MDFLKQTNLVLNRELWKLKKKKKKRDIKKKPQNKTKKILVLIKTSEKPQILKLGKKQNFFHLLPLLLILLLFNLFGAPALKSSVPN